MVELGSYGLLTSCLAENDKNKNLGSGEKTHEIPQNSLLQKYPRLRKIRQKMGKVNGTTTTLSWSIVWLTIQIISKHDGASHSHATRTLLDFRQECENPARVFAFEFICEARDGWQRNIHGIILPVQSAFSDG